MPTEPSQLRMLVLDVDGVLTDGGILLDDRGVETKRYNVRDGFGIKMAQRCGLRVGILTGRSSQTVALRAAELGIDPLVQNAGPKGEALEALCDAAGVFPKEVAYMGDDLPDLPALLRCGYPMTVADAAGPVREAACFVTRAPGGHGAVREAVEHLLQLRGQWDAVVESYRG